MTFQSYIRSQVDLFFANEHDIAVIWTKQFLLLQCDLPIFTPNLDWFMFEIISKLGDDESNKLLLK